MGQTLDTERRKHSPALWLAEKKGLAEWLLKTFIGVLETSSLVIGKAWGIDVPRTLMRTSILLASDKTQGRPQWPFRTVPAFLESSGEEYWQTMPAFPPCPASVFRAPTFPPPPPNPHPHTTTSRNRKSFHLQKFCPQERVQPTKQSSLLL